MAAAFALGALVALSVARWDWVGGTLSGAGRGIAGLWKDEEEADRAAFPFLMNPVTGQSLGERELNTVLAVTGQDGTAEIILYLSWSGAEGSLEGFMLPAGLVGKAPGGEDVSLADSLKGRADNQVDFRYLVESVTSRTLHYVVALPKDRLLFLGEALDLPPAEVEAECGIVNSFTGATETLHKGMLLKDTDRILSYMLASGTLDANKRYRDSCSRISRYLPAVMERERDRTQEVLTDALADAGFSFSINPSPGSDREKAAYLASLITAWSGSGTVRVNGAPRIEVLNGCGVVGAGTAFKQVLEKRGYEVADATRNAKKEDGEANDFSYHTSVVYFGGGGALQEAYARYLALLFKIPKVERRDGVEGLVIVVGSDLAAEAANQ